MTEKRFTNVEVDDYYNLICVNDGDTFHSYSEKALEDLLNELSDENRQLKKELNIYRMIATCSNCKYQDYDWFEDGDEFEICEKGNNNQQMEYHICKEWEEF